MSSPGATDPERFADYYEPILCLLATAVEPVDLRQVVDWATRFRGKTASPTRVKEVMDDWSEFLNDEPDARGGRLYRLYHASFQEFLCDEVGLEQYHSSIAQTALDRIPGWPGGAR